MGFATYEYTGDTSSSDSARVILTIPKTTTMSNDDARLLKPKGVFERTCKKCGSPFDSLKRKAQVCLQCKQKKKKTGR